MVKCFACGLNLYNILEEGKKISGINITDKFGSYDKKKFEEFLNEKKLDDCCRIILITYIPNKDLHYL